MGFFKKLFYRQHHIRFSQTTPESISDKTNTCTFCPSKKMTIPQGSYGHPEYWQMICLDCGKTSVFTRSEIVEKI